MPKFDVIYVFNIEINGNNFVMENILSRLDNYYKTKVQNDLLKDINDNYCDGVDCGLEMVDFAGMTLKNRYVVSVMTDAEFFNASGVKDNYFEFYKKLAKTDVGLIVTGGIYGVCEGVKAIGVPVVNCLEQNLDKWKEFVKEIHSSGAKIMLTIKPNFGRCNPHGKVFDILSGSASFNKNYNNSELICARLSDRKCDEIVSNMKGAAMFAKSVGFDGVMIDGGFEEVLGEFSTKEFNRRVFGYYSEIHDLAIKCVKVIVKEVGDLPVMYKLSLQTFFRDVYDKNIDKIETLKSVKKETSVTEVVGLIKSLVGVGIDAFYFQVGNYETEFLNEDLPLKKPCLFCEYVEHIIDYLKSQNLKNKFEQPIGCLLKYNEFFSAKNNDYLFDITKNIYADTDFIVKQKTQKHIKKCIKCNKCIDFKQKYDKNACAINPELNYNLMPIGNSVNNLIAIVGGGLSGVVCALTIARRGGKCDLFEKNDLLNIFSDIYSVYGYDDCIKEYNNYLKCEILKNAKLDKINVKTNIEVIYDANFVKKYDTIIVATGAHEKLLNVNGAVQKHVVSIYDFLKDRPPISTKQFICIYAKTELSLKLAIYLAKNKAKVTVLVNNQTKLLDIPNANFTFYLEAFKRLGVEIVLISRIKKINEDSVDVFVNNKLKNKDTVATILNLKSKKKYSYLVELKTIDATLFIYEPELVPNNKLYYDLVKNKFRGQVYLVGDALEIGDLDHAVKTGFFVGNNI